MTTTTGVNALIQSRRFWTLLVDTVLSLVLYFGGKYFAVAIDDIKFLIIAVQPIFAVLISAFTIDDINTRSLAQQLQMHQATVSAQSEQMRYAAEVAKGN